MILDTRPPDFEPVIEVVGCYVMVGDEFLMLQRNDDKVHGGQWCMPAGKVDDGEPIDIAVARELFEETAITIDTSASQFYRTLDVRNNGYDILFHMFSADFEFKPDVVLENAEHQNYQWVTYDQAMKLDCVHDFHEHTTMFFKDYNKPNEDRDKTSL